jgi:hypothetical protein
MNTISSWEAQTKELLSRVGREINEIQADTERRMATLQQRKWAIEEALRAYAEMMGYKVTQESQSLSPSDVEGKSYKEILRLIAQRNNGLLIVRHAIRLMKEVDIFINPHNADSVVYSTLNRSSEFVKIGKGVYKLNGAKEKVALSIKRGRRGGLQQAIKELKEENPQMTKSEVQDALIRRGFDFKDKKPGRAVHMAWVRLGYAKQKKEALQTSLI